MLISLIHCSVLLLVLGLAVGGSALAQTTVTMMQGLNAYTGTTDARIGIFNADMNFGGTSTMFLTEENKHSFFVRFAIFAAEGGPVPDNAVVTSATLSLYKYGGPAAVIKASRVKRAWNEMEITWNVAAAGVPWQTAGALGANDVEASADGQGSVGDAAADGCADASAPAVCWLNIDVTSGVQAFRSGAPNHGWKLAYVSGGVANDNKEFFSSENGNSSLRPKLTVTYTVCAPGPFGGTPWGVGEIEAENFDCGGEGVGYHDTTPGNQMGSTYRDGESVDVWDIPAGGRTVRDFHTGEWMDYTISVPAGTYALAISAAHNATPGQYRIELDGVDVTGSVTVPGTGSWDVYQWVQAPSPVTLTAGTHVLRLVSVQQAYRVDKIRLEATSPPASCEDPPQRPFTGSAIQIPSGGATFEAENYDCGGEGTAYHDTTSGNEFASPYRPDESVDIWDMPEGGQVVRNFNTGEWMEYTVNIAVAGAYRLGIRAGHNATPGQYRIEVDGNDATGNVTVPGTGSWDVYEWVDSPTTVNLTAGMHVLRLVSVQQAYRVEKLHILPADGGGGTGAIDPADIRVWARADVPFAQQSNYTAQVINTYTSAQNIPESGIHYTQMSNGETLRLGKVADPVNAGEQALAFQVVLSDPTTSGGKRAELSGPKNVVMNNVYWVALKVYVYDWGNLGTSDGSLFGAQMHQGDPNRVVGGPSFSLYATQGGRFFRVQARYSTSSSPSSSNSVSVKFDEHPMPFGRWVDFVLKFKHNTAGSGFLQVWMDGQQIVSYTGHLGYNTGYNDYVKFGYYNWQGSGSAPRKVLLRSPVLVADPSGSKYTAEQLRSFVNQ